MKVRFVSGPTTMPVAQNTPRITKGVQQALMKWKMRMLTREAVPTATTASRIEIGIRVTMLGHLKCLPNQPRSNRIESAQFRRRHRIGRRSTGSERHVDLRFYVARRRDRVVPRKDSSLRQHDLNGAHVRRAAILGGFLLPPKSHIPHLRLPVASAPNHLPAIDRPGDRTPAGAPHHRTVNS